MLTCGACGTVNYYVFCTECGIKLPEENEWVVLDHGLPTRLKVTVDPSFVENDIKEKSKQAVLNMRRTTELSINMYKALGITFDEAYLNQLKAAATISDAVRGLQLASWRG